MDSPAGSVASPLITREPDSNLRWKHWRCQHALIKSVPVQDGVNL